jgi:hypothetical protein
MAQWRKVVVSGSNAVLNQISASGNIVPTSDNGVDLGSSTLEFKDLYIDGTANVDSLSADTAAIGDLTSGRVVFAGGSGELQDSSNFTFATDTLTATKIGAFEAAGAIDFSDENMTNVDIDSGAIDGVTIGGASAGAITGTTIDATTDFTIGGTVITDNTITDDGTLVIASTTATSFSDGNITNVGDIALDTISADDGSSLSFSNNWTNAGNTIADLGTVSAATSITATDLIGTNIDGIIGADTARAGTFTTVIASSHISSSANITGSAIYASSGFYGDGSNLTGVGFQIDELSNTLTAVDQADLLVVADADASNEEKKITFSNFEDEIFGNVSGDVLIAAGGAATIQATSVENSMLADDAVDSDEIASGAVDDDHLSDGVATGLAGAGMTATSGVMNVIGTAGAVSVGADAVTLVADNTTLTSILNSSLSKIGTATSEEYIKFDTSNEVNTHIGDSEILSVTATGVDITGVATVSSDLTVGGNLDVNGTVTTINTANLAVNDQFIQLASGSTSETDGGIIVTKQADQAGYALGYDGGTDQWSFQNDLSPTATGIVPDAYVGVIERGTGAGDSQGDPTYGGASNGAGTIYIDTDDGEIWIYA